MTWPQCKKEPYPNDLDPHCQEASAALSRGIKVTNTAAALPHFIDCAKRVHRRVVHFRIGCEAGDVSRTKKYRTIKIVWGCASRCGSVADTRPKKKDFYRGKKHRRFEVLEFNNFLVWKFENLPCERTPRT